MMSQKRVTKGVTPTAFNRSRLRIDMIIKPDAGTIIQSIPAHGQDTDMIIKSGLVVG